MIILGIILEKAFIETIQRLMKSEVFNDCVVFAASILRAKKSGEHFELLSLQP